MSVKIKILIVEHSADDIELMQYELKKGGIDFEEKIVQTKQDYESALTNYLPDLILSDYSLPSFDGATAFIMREALAPGTPFIFVSGSIGEEHSVEYIKRGVTDYVLKDKLFTLTVKVKRALGEAKEKQQKDKTEQELKKSENRFRALIEKSSEMITLSTAEGEMLYGSPSITKVFGYSAQEIHHTFALDFIHPDDIEMFSAGRRNIMKTQGESFNSELRLRHKSGAWIWCEATLTNMLHEPGINAMVANFRDVSDRKVAKQKLVNTSDFLEKALNDLQKTMNASLDVICSIDVEGRFVNVSAASERIFGYKPDELKGKKYIELVLTDDVESTNNAAAGVMDGHSVTMFENRYIHKNGTIVPIIWSATWDKDDQLMYCIAKDITERKAAEQEKQKITDDLLQRNKDLEQFTYIVSHNLRSPVANILGISEALRTLELQETEKEEMMYSLSASVMKLNTVILDLNHILQTKRNVSEEKEKVSFGHLVKNIRISIAEQIKNENAEIKTDFSEIDKMETLKSYLYSVFYNLISNSIKYRQPDLTPVIEIKSYLMNDEIKIQYSDNGLGIDLKKKGDQVFGLYKRFHDHKEGKGMGLFMVKTQVEALGGKISIESEVNKGTKFILQFPV